jgi:hypothetical protein
MNVVLNRRPAKSPEESQMSATTTATMTSDLTIRRAYPDDRDALIRLAQLDSGRAPAGAALVAESGGRIVAALDVERGSVIADPFVPTVNIVELLRLHASRAAHEGRFPRPRAWIRSVFGPTLPLDRPAT